MKSYKPIFREYFDQHREEYIKFARKNGMLTPNTDKDTFKSLCYEVFSFLRFQLVCPMLGWTDPKPMPLGSPYDATFKDRQGRRQKIEFKIRFYAMDDIFFDKGEKKSFLPIEPEKYAELRENGVGYILMFFPVMDATEPFVVNWALFKVGEGDKYVKDGPYMERDGGDVYHTELVAGKASGFYLEDCLTYGLDDYDSGRHIDGKYTPIPNDDTPTGGEFAPNYEYGVGGRYPYSERPRW